MQVFLDKFLQKSLNIKKTAIFKGIPAGLSAYSSKETPGDIPMGTSIWMSFKRNSWNASFRKKFLNFAGNIWRKILIFKNPWKNILKSGDISRVEEKHQRAILNGIHNRFYKEIFGEISAVISEGIPKGISGDIFKRYPETNDKLYFEEYS